MNTTMNTNMNLYATQQQMRNKSRLRWQSLTLCVTVSLTAAAILLSNKVVYGADRAVTLHTQEATTSHSAVSSMERPVVAGEDNSKPTVERWFVLPVSTDLQRVWCGTNTKAFVLVDGEGFRANRSILDAKALDLQGMRRQLQPYAKEKGATVVFFIPLVIYNMTTVSSEGAGFGLKEEGPTDYVTWVLECALEGFGRQVGFQDSAATTRSDHGSGSEDWNSYVSTLKTGLRRDALREEVGVGNDSFTVYPVQTTLSRLIFGSVPGGLDCVLVLHDSTIGSEQQRAIEQSVAKLSLAQKRCLLVASNTAVGSAISHPQFYRERLGFAQLGIVHLSNYPSKRLNAHR